MQSPTAWALHCLWHHLWAVALKHCCFFGNYFNIHCNCEWTCARDIIIGRRDCRMFMAGIWFLTNMTWLMYNDRIESFNSQINNFQLERTTHIWLWSQCHWQMNLITESWAVLLDVATLLLVSQCHKLGEMVQVIRWRCSYQRIEHLVMWCWLEMCSKRRFQICFDRYIRENQDTWGLINVSPQVELHSISSSELFSDK